MPFSSCRPRSSNAKPEPSTRSRVVDEARISPGLGQREQSRRKVDRQAADVVADDLDLAGVDRRPDLEVERRGHRSHRLRAGERPGRRVEPGEKAVAGRLDLDALELLDRAPGGLVVIRQERMPAVVAEAGGSVGRADDVGEHDGREDPLAGRQQRCAERADARPGDADPRLVADDPRVVPGRDLVDRLGPDLHRGAVGHLDVETTRDHEPEVVVLAPLGSGERLDMLGPAPAGLDDLPPDGRFAEMDELDPPVVEPAHVVRPPEAS